MMNLDLTVFMIELTDVTNRMDFLTFYSMYCSLLESYCKANKLEVTEVIEKIYKNVLNVNKNCNKK